MMSTVTTTDALHQAIVDAMRAKFGTSVAQYGAYEEWGEGDGDAVREIKTPALLTQVERMEIADTEDPDPLGRMAWNFSLAIHCVLSVLTENLQQTLPQFAAAVGALVLPPLTGDQIKRGNSWGLGGAVENPEGLQCDPGEFTPGLNGRDSWVVRWTQTVYLAEEVPL